MRIPRRLPWRSPWRRAIRRTRTHITPWVARGTFRYPVKQKWFATYTQMANEPTYVDGGERPDVRKIYYHSGLDIGGREGDVEVVAATDGLVVWPRILIPRLHGRSLKLSSSRRFLPTIRAVYFTWWGCHMPCWP